MVSPQYGPSLLSGPILGLTLPSTPSHKVGPLTTQERPPADPAPVTFPHRLRPPPAVPTGPSVPTFESPCPGDLFDKPCLDSLRQNSSLSLGPSLWTCYTNYCIFFFFGLVCLFIYLVLWVDGFHEIGKNFKQHFKIYFLLRSSPSGTPNTCTLDCWLLLSR